MVPSYVAPVFSMRYNALGCADGIQLFIWSEPRGAHVVSGNCQIWMQRLCGVGLSELCAEITYVVAKVNPLFMPNSRFSMD